MLCYEFGSSKMSSRTCSSQQPMEYASAPTGCKLLSCRSVVAGLWLFPLYQEIHADHDDTEPLRINQTVDLFRFDPLCHEKKN